MTKYSSIYSKEGKEEILGKTKDQPKFGRGLVTLVAVGAGMYLAGRFTGANDGYRLGFNRGIIHAVNSFSDGMKLYLDERRVTKGD